MPAEQERLHLGQVIRYIGRVPTSKRWIVTARFTVDGANVWRRADGTWSRQLADAGLCDDEAAAKTLAAAANKTEQREVSDPYVIEVGVGDDGAIDPLTARERIRATGPTVPIRRPDTGLAR